MDKRQKTIAVVKALYSYQDGLIQMPDLIKIVCDYFDFIKESNLQTGDLKFLKKISNIVGIPHYFDHLRNFQKVEPALEDFCLSTLSAHIYESTLHTDELRKIHRYQKEVLQLFAKDRVNRCFLSASTSFGKTHLAFDVLKKMKYKNVVLIFPTIALLAENLERLHTDNFFSSYNFHTLSDAVIDAEKDNIFIYTPERFLSFIEKHSIRPNFDFIFIDEVYKIDNEYIIDEDEKQENERDVSYRIAAYYSVMGSADVLLAGPYIEKYSDSFNRFLSENGILKCDFNKYEIVEKSFHDVKMARSVAFANNFQILFDDDENGKQARLNKIVSLIPPKENCIIYCSTPSYAEKYSKKLPQLIDFNKMPADYQLFVEHVSREYGEDWIVPSCLKKGVGVHHGLIPKYIQKEIISFFNDGLIKAITSTTTITEGVNTSAKNLIVTMNKKGLKPLKKFDAKNIAGRAGRFDCHYSGRVIALQNNFLKDISSESDAIQHKNYDLQSRKDEIDLFYSKNEFLTEADKLRRDAIVVEQSIRKIPDQIIDMFKVVSKAEKITVYDQIVALDQVQMEKLKALIQRVNTPSHIGIDWDGMQVILNCIFPITKGPMNFLIERKTNDNEGDHSIMVVILHGYLEGGFKGLVEYNRNHRNENIDTATRSAAKFVYNTAKYQLVKYLGVFNLMYKFHRAQSEGISIDEIAGIDRLLTKLEYNALTEEGRKVSDYGVPAKVLQYYENGKNSSLKNNFDSFEKKVFDKVEQLIARS
jgi:hypothetical protein